MSNKNTINDIQELNLSYLLLAQRLCLQDIEYGAFSLGIDCELAEAISHLSATQLMELSRTNQLLCRPSIETKKSLQAIVSKPRDQGLNSLHTALMLAGREE